VCERHVHLTCFQSVTLVVRQGVVAQTNRGFSTLKWNRPSSGGAGVEYTRTNAETGGDLILSLSGERSKNS